VSDTTPHHFWWGGGIRHPTGGATTPRGTTTSGGGTAIAVTPICHPGGWHLPPSSHLLSLRNARFEDATIAWLQAVRWRLLVPAGASAASGTKDSSGPEVRRNAVPQGLRRLRHESAALEASASLCPCCRTVASDPSDADTGLLRSVSGGDRHSSKKSQ